MNVSATGHDDGSRGKGPSDELRSDIMVSMILPEATKKYAAVQLRPESIDTVLEASPHLWAFRFGTNELYTTQQSLVSDLRSVIEAFAKTQPADTQFSTHLKTLLTVPDGIRSIEIRPVKPDHPAQTAFYTKNGVVVVSEYDLAPKDAPLLFALISPLQYIQTLLPNTPVLGGATDGLAGSNDIAGIFADTTDNFMRTVTAAMSRFSVVSRAKTDQKKIQTKKKKPLALTDPLPPSKKARPTQA